ncbi:MAG: exosome complex RNA-binding protein Csl4 [Candidatus Methanofastidiosia archaeon]
MPKSGDFVVPGELLGVAEEFLPGLGAYEEDGKIYSSICGYLDFNMKKRFAFVHPKVDLPPTPKEGDTVICEVVNIKEKMAYINIIALRGREEREITGSTKARIYISQSAKRYVQRLSNEFRTGDIVRARVLDTKRENIEVSTVGADFGVIRALCTKCRTPLRQRGNKLECPDCGHLEIRKIASDYGSGKL